MTSPVTFTVPTPGNRPSGQWLEAATALVRQARRTSETGLAIAGPATASLRIGPEPGPRSLVPIAEQVFALLVRLGAVGTVEDVTAFSVAWDAAVEPGRAIVELTPAAPPPRTAETPADAGRAARRRRRLPPGGLSPRSGSARL